MYVKFNVHISPVFSCSVTYVCLVLIDYVQQTFNGRLIKLLIDTFITVSRLDQFIIDVLTA